jgi:2-amino-4-hydroxy-6-hydroxymethyldihydropteridine diphosphokinase
MPAWARVSEVRREHIARVVALLDSWAGELALSPEEHAAWTDAGRLHDALRDASEDELRHVLGAGDWFAYGLSADTLHGPAAAALLEAEGERRTSVIEAVRHHTTGSPGWDRVGRALYMADFLEPGRPFARADRAFMAGRVVNDFDGVFRQVLRLRMERALREGNQLFSATVDLWNQVAGED